MATKRINKALLLVRFIEKQPGILTYPEACGILGLKPNSYRYLIDTGVLAYAPKAIRTGKVGSPTCTIKLGPNGRAKMEWHRLGGAMAPIL